MRRDTEDNFDTSAVRRPWGPAYTAAKVVETLLPFVLGQREVRLRAVLEMRLDSVTVLLDAPRDPHNAAAVLRSCDAFGVQTVHIVLRGEPFLVSQGVATGAERWVDTLQHESAADALAELHGRDYALIAAHPEGRLRPEDLARVPRLALVLGNEHAGISRELLDATVDSVSIPMRGFVESLNLSVSAAVLLAAATQGRPGDLTAAQLEAVHAHWLCNSVPRAMDILAAVASASEPVESDTTPRPG